MIIIIQKVDGETFTFECEPTDYVDDLRDRVEEVHGIPAEYQRYTLDGKPLDDTTTLEENNVYHSCTLVMMPLKIMAIQPSNKKIWLVSIRRHRTGPAMICMMLTSSVIRSKTLKATDLVMKVKKAVSKKTGLSADCLAIVFDNQELSDRQTIADCNIEHGDMIVVETFTIRVSHWGGDIFTFKDINPRDTIDCVKYEILRLCQIPLDDQKYLYDERTVNNYLSIRDQIIRHKGVIDLQKPPVKTKEKLKLTFFPVTQPVAMLETSIACLTVKHWDGITKHDLKFDLKGYVDDLKESLMTEYGIPLAHLRLSYNGAALDDTEPIEDQGVMDGSTLVMEPLKVSIQVPGQKKPFRVTVVPTDRVSRIKRIIAKKCGMEVIVQFLFLDGIELKDKQTVADCQLEHGSELRVESFTIIVEHWSGEPFTITTVKPNDLIDDVKMAVNEFHDVPYEVQKYEFMGKPINDFMALSDQQIRHGSRLQLVIPPEEKKIERREKFKLEVFGVANVPSITKPMAGNDKIAATITLSIKHWNGQVFNVEEFDPLEYVESLKEKINQLKDIPQEQQRLSFRGVLLDDTETLQEKEISDGSELLLEPLKVSLIFPNGSKPMRITLCPDDKVKKVKRIIAKKRQLEADKLCLQWNGEILLDENKTLIGYGIEYDDEIKVEMFEVTIAHWSGDMFVLDDIHPDDSIDDIRNILWKRKKIPPTEQRLTFHGKPIHSILSLRAQQIQHKSFLVMEDPNPSLFSPKSPRPTISRIKDIDTDDEFDYDDVSDAGSVASWLKTAAHDEAYTDELCKIEASTESWLGMEAAKDYPTRKTALRVPAL